MGFQILDQYTLLHLAAGVIAYFWRVPALLWFLGNVAFEWGENTEVGMKLVNEIAKFIGWPGGKKSADAMINMVGDTIAAVAGWYAAYYLDELGKKMGWYPKKT